MSEVRRNRNFGIMIPVCLCAILVIANLMQYIYFYRVLNEVYKICKEVSGENALALMEYTNNLETDSLLSTGLTVISIAVAMWIGLNIYNVVNKQDVENTLESFKEAQKEAFENNNKAYLYKYIFEERTDSRLLELAKEQIGIAKGLNPDAPGTKFIQRNIYEADGNFKEAYECVGEDMIKKDDENDKNAKLRKRYDEKMKQCNDK